jgi:hypothetical protein
VRPRCWHPVPPDITPAPAASATAAATKPLRE